MRFLLLLLHCLAAHAAEPFLRPGDVVVLVGGEEIVVAAELGQLEARAQLALPAHRLTFRSLAREGDTAFEQKRDVNYPSLAEQLDRVGATVVLCSFGKMERAGGSHSPAEWQAAHAALLRVFSKNGERRIAAIAPAAVLADAPWREAHAASAREAGALEIPGAESQPALAAAIVGGLGLRATEPAPEFTALVAAKNQLWHHYYRPQNWAFLAGDRTNQPSSRDHLDRSKRWFPAELEKFLPLIAAKEREIWAQVAR